jgi:hypothetical protein
MVETKTTDNGSGDITTLNKSLTRYQHDNHLGSACLELNEDAGMISYEGIPIPMAQLHTRQ